MCAWSTAAPSRSGAAGRSRAARWRCRCSRSTPSAPAAARSRGGTPAARSGSARARPAPIPVPACYGRGGTEPTVTDANLVLGYLSADAPLGGGVELDREAAEQTRSPTSPTQLDLDVTACAEGIRRVAGAEMIRALRVVTVQRGIDPRRYALMAFGGAGGLHAAQIADELGIDTILCPRASGVLAALGLVVSPRRRDVQRSVLLSGDELTAERDRATRETSWASAPARRCTSPTPSCTSSTSSATGASRSSSRSPAPRTPQPDELREAFEIRARGALRLPRRRPGARARHDPGDRHRGRGRRRARRRRRRRGRGAVQARGHARTATRSSSRCCAESRLRARRSKVRPWSSCPSRRCSSRPGGAARSTTPARSA